MKKSLVIVAAALVFASACQKEQLVPEGNFSIKATREACVDTKATVSDAGAFAWVPNDAIGVYNGTGFSELTTTGSGASATFTGTVVGTPQTCALSPSSVAPTRTVELRPVNSPINIVILFSLSIIVKPFLQRILQKSVMLPVIGIPLNDKCSCAKQEIAKQIAIIKDNDFFIIRLYKFLSLSLICNFFFNFLINRRLFCF